jgi:hypothetical protein
MYQVRLWSARHSCALERIYNIINPAVLVFLRATTKIFGRRLDKPITLVERTVKQFFFDCQMCGDCVLSKTGMSCPMNCPKTIRNGPCGGVRADGMCEVEPQMRCVWVEAWDGAKRMKSGDNIKQTLLMFDHRNKGKSSWLKVARDE